MIYQQHPAIKLFRERLYKERSVILKDFRLSMSHSQDYLHG